MVNSAKLHDEARKLQNNAIDFCKRLVQTASETGNEEAVANLFRIELEKLGFDSVVVDDFGNVCCRIAGGAGDGNMLFSGHLDHVGVETHLPGREGRWPFDPFEGRLSEGYIWGRGASDVKGSLAAQVYAAYLLKSLGIKLSGDLIIAGVVNDEPAFPLGIRYLCETTLPHLGWFVDAAVVGSATGLEVALGHMGKVELEVCIEGLSRHVSLDTGEAINPIYESQTLLDILKHIGKQLPESPVLGKEKMAPTIVETLPKVSSIRPWHKVSSIIPSEYLVIINWRFLPGRTKEQVIIELEKACLEASKKNRRFKCRVRQRNFTVRSYRGFEKTVSASCDPFLMSETHPFVRRVKKALEAVGRAPHLITWPVPTYAGYLGGTLGIPTVGYSPCEYRFNHTPEDRISVEGLCDAIVGYAAIALGIEN